MTAKQHNYEGQLQTTPTKPQLQQCNNTYTTAQLQQP